MTFLIVQSNMEIVNHSIVNFMELVNNQPLTNHVIYFMATGPAEPPGHRDNVPVLFEKSGLLLGTFNTTLVVHILGHV